MIKESSLKLYEVATVDTRHIKYADGTDPDVIAHLVGKYPFETTVYQLVAASEPLTTYEELFGDTINVDANYRRNLAVGDLYLSRSKTADSASLEHQSVVDALREGKLDLLTNKERLAIYGVGETVN